MGEYSESMLSFLKDRATVNRIQSMLLTFTATPTLEYAPGMYSASFSKRVPLR